MTGQEGRDRLERYVDEWSAAVPWVSALVPQELSISPHVAVRDGETLNVVFDAKAGSRHWKDLLVGFVGDAEKALGVRPEGFDDLVGGRFRPTSQPRQTLGS
jgi:hypothetical protein